MFHTPRTQEPEAPASSLARRPGQVHKSKRGMLNQSVYIKDFSKCTPMSGYLQKKNRHGVFQRRWFELRTHYLAYSYKHHPSEGEAKADDAEHFDGDADHAVIDIAQIDHLLPDPSTVASTKVLTLMMTNGDKYELMATSASDRLAWANALSERLPRWPTENDDDDDDSATPCFLPCRQAEGGCCFFPYQR